MSDTTVKPTYGRITNRDKLALGRITNRDHAGRHFTEIYPDAWLERMEQAGLITIDRPVHGKTQLPYSQEYWSVEVSSEVADWFDDAGRLKKTPTPKKKTRSKP